MYFLSTFEIMQDLFFCFAHKMFWTKKFVFFNSSLKAASNLSLILCTRALFWGFCYKIRLRGCL